MDKKNNAKKNVKKPIKSAATKNPAKPKPAKKTKQVHLESLAGKSKAEKKERRERYIAAMERLEKAQAKYTTTHKGNGKYVKGQNAKQGKVSNRTERQKRWIGWNESGESSPVVTYSRDELLKKEENEKNKKDDKDKK